jgi:hypothetical protein
MVPDLASAAAAIRSVALDTTRFVRPLAGIDGLGDEAAGTEGSGAGEDQLRLHRIPSALVIR